MSDFFSQTWHVYIAAVTVVGLIACLVLLFVASRRTVVLGPDGREDPTTGHVWDDDLRELNNPLPRWWVILFVLTVLFAGVYLTLFPGLGSRSGTLGWSSAGEYTKEQQAEQQSVAPIYAAFDAKSPEQLVADPAARALGERLFLSNCAQCHGSDGRGSKGFPNLTDGDWLWGGAHERIVETITAGRQGMMPPMAAAVGGPEEIRQVAHYVLSLSGSAHNNIAAQLGRDRFGACAACHGAKGDGNPMLGAPRLNDKVWLHGWGEAAITRMVNEGKHNVMPAFGQRLTPSQIRVLAAYVEGLSGHKATVQAAAPAALNLPTPPVAQ